METCITSIEAFIRSTAWSADVPPSYGLLHICFTVCGFVISWYCAKALRNIDSKKEKALLLSAGLFLAASEIYKQLLCYFVINDGAYDWSDLPFQLCSVPMYLCIIAPLLSPGKLQRSMYSFMMCYNLLGGAISFAEPSGLLHSYVTLTAHSLLWHMLLVFIGLYLAFSGKGGCQMKDYICATKVFLFLCGIAFTLNVTLQAFSSSDVNMFFIGPGNSPIIVFKQIAEAFGWYIGTAIYIPAVCVGAYLVFRFLQYIQLRQRKVESII